MDLNVEEVQVEAAATVLQDSKVETLQDKFTSFINEDGLVINLKEGKDIHVEFVID